MDRSPFGSLPPELRVEIYKLVLVQNRDIQLIDRGGKIICANTFDGQRRHNILAITACCKLAREESLPVFYGCDALFLNTKPDPTSMTKARTRQNARGRGDLRTTRTWPRRIGRVARIYVKRLTFDPGFWSPLTIVMDVEGRLWPAAPKGAQILKMPDLEAHATYACM